MKPTKLNVIRIGSRDSIFRKLHIHPSIGLLNHAVKSRLPVPNAILLPDAAWQRLCDDGIVSVHGQDVTVHSADDFLQRFALTKLRTNLAIRPIFSAETPTLQTAYDQLPTCLDVPFDQPETIIRSIVDNWQTTLAAGQPLRRDILVMQMVAYTIAGTASTSPTQPYDYAKVNGAEEIPLGELTNGFGRNHSASQPGWQRRVQQLLVGVKRSFNLRGDAWEIEWVDDGKRCWLLFIRPKPTTPQP